MRMNYESSAAENNILLIETASSDYEMVGVTTDVAKYMFMVVVATPGYPLASPLVDKLVSAEQTKTRKVWGHKLGYRVEYDIITFK